MEVASTSSGSTLTSLGAGGLGGTGALGKEDFLQLLVTQLVNQNPLSPVQDQEFVAQLAQFSSLEQLENLNSSMASSLILDQSVNNALATNLIGKEVLVEGDTSHLSDTGDVAWQIALGSDASVRAVVRNAAGEVVRTIEIGQKEAGIHDVVWDGLDDSGARASEGDYKLELVATDASGNAVSSSTRIRALVTGLRFVDGTGYLLMGDVTLPLGSVVEVSAPRSGS